MTGAARKGGAVSGAVAIAVTITEEDRESNLERRDETVEMEND